MNPDITQANFEKVMDEFLISPWHVANGNNWDVGTEFRTTANVWHTLECNAAVYEAKNLPSHITRMWDSVTNLVTVDEFVDAAAFVARIRLSVAPVVAAAGFLEYKLAPNTVPPEFEHIIETSYKADTFRAEKLITFYAGTQVKQYGAQIQIRTTQACDVWLPSLWIHKT